jgi:prepilin signal peptidase PulO-like enzyme (type II secretory pathway)
MLLGGRCRGCRAPIATRYLLVEALTAMLFTVVVYRHVLEVESQWGACFAVLLLVAGLIVAAFVDIDIRQIPDQITVGGMHLLPVAALVFPGLHTLKVDGTVASLLAAVQEPLRRAGGVVPDALRAGPWPALVVAGISVTAFGVACYIYGFYRRAFLPAEPRRFRDVSLAGVIAGSLAGVLTFQLLRPESTLSPPVYSFWVTMAGMAAGSGLVFLVGVVGSRLFRKPAMGFGDVKLMGLLGGFTGAVGAVAGFFVACVLGSLVGVGRWIVFRDRYLPFGPFLSLGCLLMILWPGAFQALFDWYLSLFAQV